MMASVDDLSALHEQVALVSAAALSASDLDHAFQLQLAEAIQASLRTQSPNAGPSSSRQGAVPEPSSDLAYALAVQEDDLARAEQDRRDANSCRVAHALSAASVRVAALNLGIPSVHVVTDNNLLHNHMLGVWHPTDTEQRLADIINEALSVRKKFKQCEISLVKQSQVNYVVQLARDAIDVQIAKSHARNACREMRETCTICLEDTDVTKIHAVEGCAHRFCFPCMKEHVRVKLLNGMLPAWSRVDCGTKLSVEGSKIFLSPPLLAIMAQRIREGQIHPGEKIYCPYPKCSALMSLSEVIQLMQESCSRYTVADATTLRKCVKCRRSFCIICKVPCHDRMTCHDYKRSYPHARPKNAKLQNLAKQRLWRQCIKCKYMIELAEGCYHMTCV